MLGSSRNSGLCGTLGGATEYGIGPSEPIRTAKLQRDQSEKTRTIIAIERDFRRNITALYQINQHFSAQLTLEDRNVTYGSSNPKTPCTHALIRGT
jgi:hypothetical protein